MINLEGMRQRMNQRFLFSICILLMMTGCINQKVVDKIQIIETVGFDSKENKMKATALYPRFEEKGKAKLNLLATESSSYYDLIPRLNTESASPIEEGQLRMVLFGKEFAKNGEFLTTVMRSFCRDPVIGTRIQLGVAEDTAESILKLTKNTNDPFYIQNLINQNIAEGNLPKMNLQIQLANFYGRGRDSYLPYLIQVGDSIKIDGLALFQGSKYVHRIDMRDAFILKILVNPIKNGSYQVRIEENGNKGFILIRNMYSKTSFSINQTASIPDITIKLNMQVSIKDIPPWIHLTNKNNIKKLEEKLNKHFQEAIQKLISLFQKYNVDPLGIEDLILGRLRNWDYKHLQKVYPDLRPTVNVKIKILQTGVGE